MELQGFLTNLGKYDEGYLVGEWVTFPIEEDEQTEVFERIGLNDEYEEYFFTDWNGYDHGEYLSIEEVNELAERLEDVDEDVMAALMDALDDFEYALDVYESDSYVFYPGWSMRDVAEDVADEYLDSILQGSALDFVKSHFDYDEYANELEWEGYYTTDNGVIEIY